MSGEISFLLVVSLLGSDPIVELATNTVAPYPEADAVVILDKREITLSEDGPALEEEEFVLKILKEAGKSRYGNRSYIYDSNVEAMKVVQARVIKSTGEVVKVPEEGINEVTPWGLARTPAYQYARQVTVSFVGLDVGDVIHLKREVKKTYPLGFGGYEVFGGLNPVVTKILKVHMPEGKELKWKAIGEEIEPKILRNEEFTSYTWKGEGLPQVILEPDMPPTYSVVPRLLYAADRNWEEAGERFAQAFYRSLRSKPTREELLPIIRGAEKKDEMIQKLFLYVAGRIRNVDRAVGMGNYIPRLPRSVLESGYGNRVDKVGFLVSGLSSLGIEAYAVLINDCDVEIVKEVPLLDQFTSLIVAVPSRPRWLWLSPFASNWRYGDLPSSYEGRDCLVVSEEGVSFGRTPSANPMSHLSRKRALLRLEGDGTLAGTMELHLRGYFDSQSRWRLSDMTKREKEVYVHTSCNKLSPGTELVSSQLPDSRDLTAPAEFTIQFRSPRYASKSGNLVIFEVPTHPFDFAKVPLQPTLKERKYAFILESPLFDEYEAILEIPKGYRTRYLPRRLSLQNPVGSLNQTYDMAGGRVKCNSRLVVKKRKIEPQEYHYLKELLENRSLPRNRLIVLESS